MERWKAKPAPEVLLYTRERCHLCEEARLVLRGLREKHAIEWVEIDIDQNEELRKRFNDEVPVVFIGGRKAFQHRIDRQLFLKMLDEARRQAGC